MYYQIILRHMRNVSLCFEQNVAGCEKTLLITSPLLRERREKSMEKRMFSRELVTSK